MKNKQKNLNKRDKEYIQELYESGKISLHKESDILSTDNIKLNDEEKKEMLEIETQLIIDDRRDFNNKLQNLYANLSSQYQIKSKVKAQKNRSLLREMIDDILAHYY